MGGGQEGGGRSGATQQEDARVNSRNQDGLLCHVRGLGLYPLGKRESLGDVGKEQTTGLLISQEKYGRHLD